MNIPQIRQKIKAFALGEQTGDILLGTAILLFGFLAFGLGKWSATAGSTGGSPVMVADTLKKYTTAPFAYYDGKAGPTGTTIAAGAATASVLASQLPVSGEYVASKNGKKYYPKNCSGANRIKPENAVWFTTESEAQTAGYTLAATCK